MLSGQTRGEHSPKAFHLKTFMEPQMPVKFINAYLLYLIAGITLRKRHRCFRLS